MPRNGKSTRSNNDTRRTNRSVKKRCKPEGKWKTFTGANDALLRLERDHPLHTLGMRVYPCPTCDHFHVGRAGAQQQ